MHPTGDNRSALSVAGLSPAGCYWLQCRKDKTWCQSRGVWWASLTVYGRHSSLVLSSAVVPIYVLHFYGITPFSLPFARWYIYHRINIFCVSTVYWKLLTFLFFYPFVDQLLVNIIKLGKYLFHIVIVVLILTIYL